MKYLQAIVLGIVQGLTEFLPVSSSAHIRIFGTLIGAGDWGDSFSAIIQLGTELVILLYYRREIGRMISHWWLCLIGRNGSDVRSLFGRGDRDAQMGWFVILGTLPIVIGGLLLQKLTSTLFRSLWITVAMLIVFGLFLWLADAKGLQTRSEDDMTWKDALWIGCGQILALIPGVSRSGSTLTVARARGLKRSTSARFSFYLAIPAVFGSGLLELFSTIHHPHKAQAQGFPGWGPTIVATVVAFVVGAFVFYLCLKILSEFSYKGFAIYRTIVAIVIALMIVGHAIPAVSSALGAVTSSLTI
jgi:undecaprenyl-diphosphatase